MCVFVWLPFVRAYFLFWLRNNNVHEGGLPPFLGNRELLTPQVLANDVKQIADVAGVTRDHVAIVLRDLMGSAAAVCLCSGFVVCCSVW